MEGAGNKWRAQVRSGGKEAGKEAGKEWRVQVMSGGRS